MRGWARWTSMVLAACFWFLAWAYLTLPDVRPLRSVNPVTTAFMDRRAAEARRAGRPFLKRHRWLAYSRMSPHLKRAVLVAEDSAFWRHEGVDYEQIKESLEVNLERRDFARGASTITQQLAKNLYLSPSKNPVRKVRELMIARRLEAELSKRRILEIYLNVIEWGDAIFGADAAARSHFGVSASQLGPEESALLAGAIINPRALDPGNPSQRLRHRQRLILRRMGRVVPPPDTQPAHALPEPPALRPADILPPVETLPLPSEPPSPPRGIEPAQLPRPPTGEPPAQPPPAAAD